jgi:hypothetical protein
MVLDIQKTNSILLIIRILAKTNLDYKKLAYKLLQNTNGVL